MPYRVTYSRPDGGVMIGGVTRGQSSAFSHHEDAVTYAAAIRSIQPDVETQVSRVSGKSDIRRCCAGYPAQAKGFKCFGCGRIV